MEQDEIRDALAKMDALNEELKQAIAKGDQDNIMKAFLGIGDVLQDAGGEDAPQEIHDKMHEIGNQSIVPTPEYLKMLNDGKPAELPTPIVGPAPEELTKQTTLSSKRVINLPKDPRELTERESHYIFAPFAHIIWNNNQEKKPIVDANGMYGCDSCDFKYENPAAIIEHVKKAHLALLESRKNMYRMLKGGISGIGPDSTLQIRMSYASCPECKFPLIAYKRVKVIEVMNEREGKPESKKISYDIYFCEKEQRYVPRSKVVTQWWTPWDKWTPYMPYPIGIYKFFQGWPQFTDFKSIATFRIIGIRFNGKSALAEAIATRYLQNGSSIYDLYAANDNESLAWLDSPYSDRVVLVHGSETTLDCEYQTLSIDDLDPKSAEDGRIYIVCKSFFANDMLYFRALEGLTDKFVHKDEWERTHVIIIREAQEWIAGRMKSGKPRSAKDSAEEFVSFHNALYHTGHAVIIDSQRDVGVAKDVRELTSWLCMKALGSMDIPRKLYWIMSFIDPTALRLMPKHLFALIGEASQLSIGWFMMPPWHIQRGKSLIKRLNIHIQHDEAKVRAAMENIMAEEGRGGQKKVGMDIHEQIVMEHTTKTEKFKKGKPLSTIAMELDLNYGTVKLQWKKHTLGACGCSLLGADVDDEDS